MRSMPPKPIAATDAPQYSTSRMIVEMSTARPGVRERSVVSSLTEMSESQPQ